MASQSAVIRVYPSEEPAKRFNLTSAARARAAQHTPATLTAAEALALQLDGFATYEQVAELVERFGSIRKVLAAETLALQATLQPAAIERLTLIADFHQRLAREELPERISLRNTSSLLRYLRATMADRQIECLRVIFTDARLQMIGDEIIATGGPRSVKFEPQSIIRRALELCASSFLLVHVHPSADCTPSAADIQVTSDIVGAAELFNITVTDHIIVGGDNHLSMRCAGLM